MPSLSSTLEGKVINNWRVDAKRLKSPTDHSGAFSSCYQVTHTETGQTAFLKALNYQYAFRATGTVSSPPILKQMTSEFEYEKTILKLCSGKKMDRVVRAIDYGEYSETGEPYPVPYIVFELADASLKNAAPLYKQDWSWKLRVFHGALVGLSQLHYALIAHQDIKPSNILMFGESYSKIGDLGRSTMKGNESGMDSGDNRFLPIELHYGYLSPNWDTRRFGADFFMMGGVLCFLLSNITFLPILFRNLDSAFYPGVCGDPFPIILPHLIQAYSKSLDDISVDFPPKIKADLLSLLSDFCHPDPEKRGNSSQLNKKHGRFSLAPYISKVNVLSGRAKWC